MPDVILTSGGLAYLADFLAAASLGGVPTPPQYIVLASGTAPVGRFMTTVPGETFRAPIAARDRVGHTTTFHTWLSMTDNAGQTIGAYGLVGGNTATLSANTGTLIAVVNEPAPFSKGATQALSVDLILTVSGTVS